MLKANPWQVAENVDRHTVMVRVLPFNTGHLAQRSYPGRWGGRRGAIAIP